MSNRIYPSLPGLMYGQIRSVLAPPVHIRTTPSRREFRSRSATLPLYQYTLAYEFLRSSQVGGQLQALVGLFNACGGSFDTLLYVDRADSSIVNDSFGVGDGVTTQFQLLREFGGFAEPIYDIDTGSYEIFIDGVSQSQFHLLPGCVIQFNAAPHAGALLTWRCGTFYRRVRFLVDQLDINDFMQDLYEAKQVQLQTVIT